MNTFLNYQLSDNTVVFTDTLKNGSPYIAHKPRNHESLFFVTKGRALYENEEKREVIDKGQVGYIARGSKDKSSAYLCDDVSYIAVNFAFDKENSSPSKTLPFKTLCSRGFVYNYEKLFKDALNHYILKTPGYISICNGIIMQIIGYLYNEHNTDVSKNAKMQRIEAAIQYLNSHFNSPELRISNLPEKVHMSEKQFRRIFYDVYNKTPYEYMQKLRITKAEILLLNTYQNITDIALQCGFCDIYSFSHCFKKHIGVSPNKYREMHM